MCLLVMTPAGHTPDRDRLEHASIQNSDGFGFAIRSPHHGILRGRGMDFDIVADWFYQLRSMYPQEPAMFHLRFTTHGRSVTDNCHPFEVAERDDILMGHNGILPIDVPATERRSDTRIFAEDWMTHWGVDVLNDAKFMDELGLWIRGSKLGFITDTPDVRDPFIIVNEGDGHWDEGSWWSNYNYEKYVPTYGTGKYGRIGWPPIDDEYESYDEWLRSKAEAAKDPDAGVYNPTYVVKDGRVGCIINGVWVEGTWADVDEEDDVLDLDGREVVTMGCWHCGTECLVDVGQFSVHEDDDFCMSCDACLFCSEPRVTCTCNGMGQRAVDDEQEDTNGVVRAGGWATD